VSAPPYYRKVGHDVIDFADAGRMPDVGSPALTSALGKRARRPPAELETPATESADWVALGVGTVPSTRREPEPVVRRSRIGA
jgi:hypothetical protein